MNSKIETEKIVSFIHGVLKKTGLKNIVVGWSGGLIRRYAYIYWLKPYLKRIFMCYICPTLIHQLMN